MRLINPLLQWLQYRRYKMSVPHFPEVKLLGKDGNYQHRLEDSIPVVSSLSDLYDAIYSPTTTGVILRRDPGSFGSLTKDLEAAKLRSYVLGSSRSTDSDNAGEYRLHIERALSGIGISPWVMSSAALIAEDMWSIRQLLALHTPPAPIRSTLWSKWSDPRGIHLDTGSTLLAAVTYVGKGAMGLGVNDLTEESKILGATANCKHLAIKSDATPILAPEIDVFICKARMDLTRDVSPTNLGQVHLSSDPNDPRYGYEQRLTGVVFAMSTSTEVVQRPDYDQLSALNMRGIVVR